MDLNRDELSVLWTLIEIELSVLWTLIENEYAGLFVCQATRVYAEFLTCLQKRLGDEIAKRSLNAPRRS